MGTDWFTMADGRAMSAVEIAWTGLGLGGQACFALRFLVQWITSERKGRTVVPAMFWYLSIAGSVAMLAYGLWLKNIVIIVGQLPGCVVYVRNLVLMKN